MDDGMMCFYQITQPACRTDCTPEISMENNEYDSASNFTELHVPSLTHFFLPLLISSFSPFIVTLNIQKQNNASDTVVLENKNHTHTHTHTHKEGQDIESVWGSRVTD
ncbi:unnamed protein product [Lota lota]